MTEAEALAYFGAGCTDPQRTAELQQAGITAFQMTVCGLGTAYSIGETSLAALLQVMLPEGIPAKGRLPAGNVP